MNNTNRQISRPTVLTQRMAAKYTKSKEVVIPTAYKAIGAEAFQKNGIESIKFPPGLKEIGKNAFRFSRNIKKVELPNSIIRIGNGCFADCQNLRSVNLSDRLETIPEEAFYADRMLKTVQFTEKSQVSKIKRNAFYECSKMDHIQLPSGVKEIEEQAFYRCKNLKTICFPKGLKVIGMDAFSFCGIEKLELPDKCTQLREVKIPESVRTIERGVFHGCNRLKVLEFRHDPDFIGEELINKSTRIRCYQGSKVDEYCQKQGYTVEYIEKQ